jgi:hypothetical protein
VLWLVGSPVLAAIGLVLAGVVLALFSGHQQIGLTARLTNWTLAWFFVPPIVLVAAWLWSRRQPLLESGDAVTTPADRQE